MQQDRRDFMKIAGLMAVAPMVASIPSMAQGAMHGPSAQSHMVTNRPFDLRHARKWAPKADPNDFSTVFPELPGVISQEKLGQLAEEQLTEWMETKTRKSAAMQKRGMKHMPWGVLGCYQKDWETPHLLYAERSMDNKVWDVDGNEYLDFNFGDTPDMFGHGPANPAVAACAKRMLEDGLSSMFSNEDALVAAELLAEKFGLSHWMHALSASDANRFVLAIARHHTGRPNIAMPNFTYHGTLEETQKFMPEPGKISRFHDLGIYHAEVTQGTKIFYWNDLKSLEEVLADRSVAVVIMEPVMSNFGWAWPKPGWHEGVKELCKKYGTLLCYDETHTISKGPRGMCGHLGIKGDFWTCGKAISSGIPGAVYGMTEEIAAKLHKDQSAIGFLTGAGLGFLGTSLCGNTMSTLALRVTMEEVLTEATYAKIDSAAAYMAKKMEGVIEKYKAPFRIEIMGNRLCYHFTPDKVYDPVAGLVQVGFGGLFELSHFYAWNHGMLIMPYFNMLLVAPTQTKEDTDRWIAVWDDIVRISMGR